MDRTLVALVAALLIALAVFAIWPGLDLAVSRLVFDQGGFLGQSEGARGAREFFRVTPYLLLIGLVLAWVARRLGFHVPFAPDARGAVFLLATMAIGPGLIVNLGMKDHLHRPRPVHVEEFGGSDKFRPWYAFDGACKKNCSFPSGEASEAFWLVAPALLAPPPVRAGLIIGAAEFGVGASALRILFGGHFLSDTIVGGLISLIVVFAVRRWFWSGEEP
jgi:membrane-associated phospholipid phosphatase